MELTKEYFDKHYEELNDFLSEQFSKVFATMTTKEDLKAMAIKEELKQGFAEQAIKLDFILADIAAVRKDLTALSKRTREDDEAFTKELLKLKNRVETLERQLKVLKTRPA